MDIVFRRSNVNVLSLHPRCSNALDGESRLGRGCGETDFEGAVGAVDAASDVGDPLSDVVEGDEEEEERAWPNLRACE